MTPHQKLPLGTTPDPQKLPRLDGKLQRWLKEDGRHDLKNKATVLRLYDVCPNPDKIQHTDDDYPMLADLPPDEVYLSCQHVWRLLESKLSWQYLIGHWPLILTSTKGISETYEPLGAPAVCTDEQGQTRYVLTCGKQLHGWDQVQLFKRQPSASQDRMPKPGNLVESGTYPYDRLVFSGSRVQRKTNNSCSK